MMAVRALLAAGADVEAREDVSTRLPIAVLLSSPGRRGARRSWWLRWAATWRWRAPFLNVAPLRR